MENFLLNFVENAFAIGIGLIVAYMFGLTVVRRERIHPEAQKQIDVLDTYAVDNEENYFDIVHMYPGEQCVIGDRGYADARFFRLVGFNTRRNTKRDLGDHYDGLLFAKTEGLRVDADIVRIFADGSTLIRFEKTVFFDTKLGGAVLVSKYEG